MSRFHQEVTLGDHDDRAPRPRVGLEDLLLAGLGTLTGPLLWWMGHTWQQHPTASSLQSLEHWIALLSGLLGVILSALWLVFIMAGLGFTIALKTKSTLIARWTSIFTPKFLQRIIISALGIQLAMGSQAFAAEAPDSETTQLTSPTPDNAFMPRVIEQPNNARQPEATDAFTVPSAEPTESDAQEPTAAIASPSAANSADHSSPRETAGIDKHAQNSHTAVEPLPRQTTTIPVPDSSANGVAKDTDAQPGSIEAFVPNKSGPTPYISPPNPGRSAEDPTVVVTRGDSLWDLAHQELGADATTIQVDRRWRQWWQYNHDTIGNDPHTLVPGSVLNAPPFTE